MVRHQFPEAWEGALARTVAAGGEPWVSDGDSPEHSICLESRARQQIPTRSDAAIRENSFSGERPWAFVTRYAPVDDRCHIEICGRWARPVIF